MAEGQWGRQANWLYEEKSEVFRRMREIESTQATHAQQMNAHIETCAYVNAEAKRDRANFRKELRGYCVAILVAILGMGAWTHFHFF